MSRLALVFRLASLAAIAAAIVHGVSMVSPSVARFEYTPEYPTWRHALFIGINLTCAWCFRVRPPWFVWAYGVLAAQVAYSHGVGAIRCLIDERRVDWISMVVTIGAPLLLAALIVDRRSSSRP